MEIHEIAAAAGLDLLEPVATQQARWVWPTDVVLSVVSGRMVTATPGLVLDLVRQVVGVPDLPPATLPQAMAAAAALLGRQHPELCVPLPPPGADVRPAVADVLRRVGDQLRIESWPWVWPDTNKEEPRP